MGIAASLFFANANTENCLAHRVKPADKQREAQQERWNDLRDVLFQKLKGRSGYSVSSWLQGSYKFGTQIRPAKSGEEFDIDLGVYFEWSGDPNDGDYGPADLKQFVQEALIEYAEDQTSDAEGVSDPKSRCNRIHFSGDFHIDVPSYHLDRSRDSRALATEANNWEQSDPKAIYIWWKDALDDIQRPRVRRLVRYLKIWAALNIDEPDRPSSILLTVLACEAYLTLSESDLTGDDEYFREIVNTIHKRLNENNAVYNPTHINENLNRLSTESNLNLIAQLDVLRATADKALIAQTKVDSADVWTEVFKHFFPLPDQEEIVKDASNNALAVVPFDPLVNVVATVKGREFIGTNQIGPIPRGCEIRFNLQNERDLPIGAEVSWVVRNSGVEAEAVNDLGHLKQNGASTVETSAYKGTHYMDVTVRLNGRAIGRRRIPVQVSGIGMPLRNPTRKPRPWLRRK